MKLLKKYNIPIVLLTLVLAIAYLSHYNYNTQKNLLLMQMEDNSLNIITSVSASIERFDDIKSTMSLQKLLSDISFDLEIFEFRYLEPNGVIKNSMFESEIGLTHSAKMFKQTLAGKNKFKEFFFEIRDFVKVMSIYYPIYNGKEIIGIIDLAVDISEYKALEGSNENFSVLRRQVDITNLLKSIEGSITNSLDVYKKTDMNNFLNSYVKATKNIVQISLVGSDQIIYNSSDTNAIGQKLSIDDIANQHLIEIEGQLTYRTITDKNNYKDMKLLFLIDASTYTNHENQLLKTALITSVVALFFALFAARNIYYSAIERSRKEKERLEMLVRERTKEIEILSKTDSLTGLWNRRHLEETLNMEFKRSRRYGFDFTIMLLDLDYFKKINDTYGHMAGDEVLREVSHIISSSLRETDFLARYGGEEIVAILPNTNLKTAKKVADGVRVTIASNLIYFEEHEIEITTSIGINTLRDDHKDYHAVFAEADKALYIAKENGRNRTEIFKV